jgi:hypothetical protein
MFRKLLPYLVPLALLLAVPLRAAQEKAAAEGKLTAPPSSTYSNQYEIRFLDLHSAEQLAWDLCSYRDSCRVRALSAEGKEGGVLGVEADALTHEKIVRELARLDVAPKTQRFQLILLAGNAKAGASPKDLSPGAQKALNDLKGFLPYKSYELLDSTLVPATREAMATARLVGQGGVAYNLRLAFRAGGSGADAQLFVSQFRLREDAGTTPLVPIRADGSGPQEHRAPRDLVDTTFSLKPGETIVVGTSRLDGSEDALVILLTALS